MKIFARRFRARRPKKSVRVQRLFFDVLARLDPGGARSFHSFDAPRSSAVSLARHALGAMADDLASLFKTGLVLECEDVPKKDKLKKLLVDVGGPDPLTIVTNAGNVGSRTVGMRVVVACVGAELRDGEKVKRAPVGGVTSEGMLCDGPMLGWAGGGQGTAALLPERFAPGDAPPSSRPRADGAAESSADASSPAAPVAKSTGPGVDALFEKKMSKEEKKAALAAKRAAKKAAKEAAEGDKKGDEGDDDDGAP